MTNDRGIILGCNGQPIAGGNGSGTEAEKQVLVALQQSAIIIEGLEKELDAARLVLWILVNQQGGRVTINERDLTQAPDGARITMLKDNETGRRIIQAGVNEQPEADPNG